jgi:hypothetical protein
MQEVMGRGVFQVNIVFILPLIGTLPLNNTKRHIAAPSA